MTQEQFIYWLKGFIEYQQIQEQKNQAFNVIKDEINKISDLTNNGATTSPWTSTDINGKPYTIPCDNPHPIGIPNGVMLFTTTEGRTDITYKTDSPITYTTK